MADTSFVFTITKEVPEEKTNYQKRNLLLIEKFKSILSTQAVYPFLIFDDYCFSSLLQESNLLNDIAHIADSFYHLSI